MSSEADHFKSTGHTETGLAIQTNPAFILSGVDEWGEGRVEIGYPSCMACP